MNEEETADELFSHGDLVHICRSVDPFVALVPLASYHRDNISLTSYCAKKGQRARQPLRAGFFVVTAALRRSINHYSRRRPSLHMLLRGGRSVPATGHVRGRRYR
mmetsp:Transcript_25786/g.83540  ORF Transcript_25786/g.83540 Transcript_25786/m.83540 type:complete len:105 (+) Transcript_25786:1777-2091(+)